MTDTTDDNEAIRTIAQAVLRTEGAVATLTEAVTTLTEAVTHLEGSVAKVATRLEQIVGMIELLDARMDRLGEAFVRHDHGEAA